MRLLPKISLIILAIFIILSTIFSCLIIVDEKKTFESFLNKEGNLLTKTISASALESVLVDDYPLLESILVNISDTYKSISFINIIKEEKIIASVLNENDSKNIIFNSEIKINDDLIAEVQLGLSRAEYDNMIKDKIVKNKIYVLSSAFIIFLLLLYIIRKYLIAPIDNLEEYTKLIDTNNSIKPLEINTKDEFSNLANSINHMSQRINHSYSELKNVTKELELQKNHLQEANKYKDDFLANISHEFKTPLNSINVISSIMSKNKVGNLSQKDIKNLNIINSSGNDLLYLINDVLDISKLEAGQLELDYSTFNIKSLLYEVTSMFEIEAKDKSLSLFYEVNDDISFIYSDNNRIKQILKNLISNSLKFTKEGYIKIICNTSKDDIKISVIDSGIGIEKNKVNKVFDRFKQADSSTTRKYGGTGLGLAICKELCLLLKGDIKLISELNKGAKFTITLPINKNKIAINEEKKINQNSEEKVLILNNDPLFFMNLSIELKKNFNLIQVSNLSDLINECKKTKFRYVILDITKINKQMLNMIYEMNNLIIFYDEMFENNRFNSTLKSFKKPVNIKSLLTNL